MGLGMYLLDEQEYNEYKEKINKCDPDSEEYWNISFPTELIYWRKANAIHRYFCSVGEEIEKEVIYKITIKDLLELFNLINIILKEKAKRYKRNRKNKIKCLQQSDYNELAIIAEGTLPTQEGFFFGSTEYDEQYYSDLEFTKESIKDIINLSNKDSFIYYASW